jgi:hypothetical protein
MNATRRLPGILLAVVAIALIVVIGGRVSAGADPAPQDTRPIVISPPAPTLAPPTVAPTESVDDDDDDDDEGRFDRTVPTPRDLDDDDDD